MDDSRLNLKLPEITKRYLKEAAWRNRMSLTQYLVNLVKEDMYKHPEIIVELKEDK